MATTLVSLGKVYARACPAGYVPMQRAACGHPFWAANGYIAQAVRTFGLDKGAGRPLSIAYAPVYSGNARFIMQAAWLAWGKAPGTVASAAMDNAAYQALAQVLDKAQLAHVCKACGYNPPKPQSAPSDKALADKAAQHT